jgi:hypothetical protein
MAAPCHTDGILSCRLLKNHGYNAGIDDLKNTVDVCWILYLENINYDCIVA